MGDARLKTLAASIHSCEKCPRLRAHCREIARTKRRSFAGETYWGKPVTGFGDANAQLVIVGLAPAAHGANRTGRIFTGDRSGDWLYRALFRAGFANQPTSLHADDGLKLKQTYITCVTRCAPPDNKPEPIEITRCLPYLETELAFLSQTQVYLALGKIALDALWRILSARPEFAEIKKPKFKHGEKTVLPNGRWLLLSYHPSQQNTFTGRLTEEMFDSVFTAARKILTT